jgi:hypothetical protein
MTYNTALKDVDKIPIAQVYPPGSSGNMAALAGSLITQTDGASNTSAPVVFHHQAGTVLFLVSTAYTISATAAGGPYIVGPYAELAADFNITVKSGTSPTLQFFIDRIGADAVAYNIWSSSVISVIGQISTSIGSGFSTNQSFGSLIQVRWVIAGTTPSWTYSVSIIGK